LRCCKTVGFAARIEVATNCGRRLAHAQKLSDLEQVDVGDRCLVQHDGSRYRAPQIQEGLAMVLTVGASSEQRRDSAVEDGVQPVDSHIVLGDDGGVARVRR